MEAELEEGGGRILLGDNTGGGAVMLRSVRFLVLQIGLQSTIYTRRLTTGIF
jgi:hypothetical protein